MKTLLRAALGFLFIACLDAAGTELVDVSFVRGPARFKAGDAITIQKVQATSPKVEDGDTVVVRGRYDLQSRDQASLSLFLTRTNGEGGERIEPAQTIAVTRGSGEFALICDVRHAGALHVSFYGIPDGRPFGGVYFGPGPQMAKIKDWKLSDYQN